MRLTPARTLWKRALRALLFPFIAFYAEIVSLLFVRVNICAAIFTGLCSLPVFGLICSAAAAQTVQNAALALQREAVLCHQVGAHLVHEVAVQMIDAPALHAFEVQMLPAVAALVQIGRASCRERV